jgi:hypothetical protein
MQTTHGKCLSQNLKSKRLFINVHVIFAVIPKRKHSFPGSELSGVESLVSGRAALLGATPDGSVLAKRAKEWHCSPRYL